MAAKLQSMEFIQYQRDQIPPEAFRREYEAEFVEDQDTWLPQDLIAKHVDGALEPWGFEAFHDNKELYMGIDLGKKVDHSVVSVIEKQEDELLLRHVHVFPLETPYASVIGYVKVLSERWRSLYKVCVDQTGSEYVVEDMGNANIPNIEGIMLSLPKKEEIAGYLRQRMVDEKKGRLHLYYDGQVLAQLNVERYELTKDGHVRLFHPEGSYDDVFWSLALAVWASREPFMGAIIPL